MQTTIQKRGGRNRNLDIRPYTLSLEEKYAEWAREQPEGISGIVRAALRLVYESRISEPQQNNAE